MTQTSEYIPVFKPVEGDIDGKPGFIDGGFGG